MHYKYILHLLFIPFLVFGQNNDKMNFGFDYSYSLYNMNLETYYENYSFDGDAVEYEWNSEELAEFNQGKFLNQFNAPSLSFFSGLSGNNQSKYRIGFKLYGGIHLANQKMKNDTRTFYSANNQNINYHYGAELQMYYTLTNKWSLFLAPNILIQEGNLNQVYILEEDIYADSLYFDQLFDNPYKLYTLNTYLAGVYSFQKLKLSLGSELIWADFKATYHESIYDKDNDYYIIVNDKITATNKSKIQAKVLASYSFSSKMGVFISLSVGGTLITKSGVYFNL